jgi:hypothetical protein
MTQRQAGMSASAKVTSFLILLGLVFGLAWLAGSLVAPNPAPSPPAPQHTMPAGSMPGMQMHDMP